MGRGVLPDDTADSHHIAVVNQEFVRQLFKPGENPLQGTISVSAAMTKLPATGKSLVWSKTLLTRAPPGKTT